MQDALSTLTAAVRDTHPGQSLIVTGAGVRSIAAGSEVALVEVCKALGLTV